MKVLIKTINPTSYGYFWLVFILCHFLSVPNSHAIQNKDNGLINRTDTLTHTAVDSLNNEALIARSEAIIRTDSLRRVDSLRQIEILDQLSQLQTTDNLKKVELLAEIEQLRNAERQSREIQKQQIDSLRAISSGFPVILYQDTLFRIYSKLGPFSPQLRAEYTVQQIEEIIHEREYQPELLLLVNTENAQDLVYGNAVLLTVTHLDAIWANSAVDELAEKYRSLVHEKITSQLERTQLGYLLKNAAAAVAIILLLYFIIKYVNRLYRRAKLYILKGRDKWYHGIKIRDYELFSTEMQSRVIVLLLNVFKWVVIFNIVYIALLILFGIFPWTKPIADTLLDNVMSPVRKIASAIWNYLPDLITIIIIVLIFRFVFKGLKYFRDEVDRGALTITGFYPEWAKPTYQVIRILLFAFMIIIIYPYLPGSDSPVFQGVSVFLGVLLTFGSSSSLSNIISGLVLTYTRAFKVGDRVRIGDSVGDIIEKNLLVTRVRTTNNEDITIPNSAVMNSHTINYSTAAEDEGLCISSTVRVSYDTPWREVHELLIDAAKKTRGVLADPPPYVIQRSLEDFSVSYEVNAYTKLANRQLGVYSSLHENIQDNFKQAGISLVAPIYGILNPDAVRKEKP